MAESGGGRVRVERLRVTGHVLKGRRQPVARLGRRFGEILRERECKTLASKLHARSVSPSFAQIWPSRENARACSSTDPMRSTTSMKPRCGGDLNRVVPHRREPIRAQ
jgi:hypothetical protein